MLQNKHVLLVQLYKLQKITWLKKINKNGEFLKRQFYILRAFFERKK